MNPYQCKLKPVYTVKLPMIQESGNVDIVLERLSQYSAQKYYRDKYLDMLCLISNYYPHIKYSYTNYISFKDCIQLHAVISYFIDQIKEFEKKYVIEKQYNIEYIYTLGMTTRQEMTEILRLYYEERVPIEYLSSDIFRRHCCQIEKSLRHMYREIYTERHNKAMAEWEWQHKD